MKQSQKKQITEQESNHQDLEKKSVSELLYAINQEDERVHLAVRKCIPQIEELVEAIIPRYKKGGRVFYIGSGTSGRLGVLDASEIPPTYGVFERIIGIIAGGDKALRNSIESAEDDREQAWKDLEIWKPCELDTLIGISASGSAAYVLGGLNTAKNNGLLTASISCNPSSEISNAVDIAIEAIVGAEFVTGSTRMKAGTAQKMILNMISTTLMIKMDRVEGNQMINMQLSNKKLHHRAENMLMERLFIPRDKSRELLLKFGSIKEVLKNI